MWDGKGGGGVRKGLEPVVGGPNGIQRGRLSLQPPWLSRRDDK